MDTSQQNSFLENNPEMPPRIENHAFVESDFANF